MRKEIEERIKRPLTQQVNLRKMNIENSEIEEISRCIVENKPDCQEIYLDNNNISDEGGVILARELSSLVKLNKISLQHNQLDKKGITALVELRLNNPNLQFALNGNILTNVTEMHEIEEAVSKRVINKTTNRI